MSITALRLAVLLVIGAVPVCGAAAQTDGTAGRIIFPFAAGGQGDALARLVSEHLRKPLGRPYIVENRTGGGGRIGIQAVKMAAADGATLLFVPIAPMSVYPHFYDKLGYDPVADFAPVSQVATFEFALAAHRNVPAASLKELIAWFKANPGKGAYGSPSPGTLPHFFGIELGRATQLDLRHVSYRGSAAAMTDLLSGQLPVAITSTSDLAEHHRAGTVRILATTGQRRSQLVAGMPTFNEAGVPVEGVGWYALYAPSQTSTQTVERISTAVISVVSTPEIRQQLFAMGLVATGTTSAQLATIQKSDLDYWGPIIRRSGYRPDQ